MLKRRMIRLLEKLISQRDGIHCRYGTSLRYTQDYRKRLSIIRKILVQEKEMFEGKVLVYHPVASEYSIVFPTV